MLAHLAKKPDDQKRKGHLRSEKSGHVPTINIRLELVPGSSFVSEVVVRSIVGLAAPNASLQTGSTANTCFKLCVVIAGVGYKWYVLGAVCALEFRSADRSLQCER